MNRFGAGRLAPVLVCALAVSAQARDLQAVVTDAQGAPVADAVVYVHAPGQLGKTKGQGQATVAVMDQRDKEFVPHVLAVRRGSEVSFPNSDNIQHHLYSFSGVKKFEVPLYKNGARPKVRFDEAGVAPLGCNIHDWMLGYIYVADSPWLGKTGADGRVTLAGVGPDKGELRVWHPRLKGEEVRAAFALADAVVPVRVMLKPERRKPRPAVYDANAFSAFN